jgi:hypothetical protein
MADQVRPITLLVSQTSMTSGTPHSAGPPSSHGARQKL